MDAFTIIDASFPLKQLEELTDPTYPRITDLSNPSPFTAQTKVNNHSTTKSSSINNNNSNSPNSNPSHHTTYKGDLDKKRLKRKPFHSPYVGWMLMKGKGLGVWRRRCFTLEGVTISWSSNIGKSNTVLGTVEAAQANHDDPLGILLVSNGVLFTLRACSTTEHQCWLHILKYAGQVQQRKLLERGNHAQQHAQHHAQHHALHHALQHEHRIPHSSRIEKVEEEDSNVDLAELIVGLKAGVPIADRKFRLLVYPQCFLGKDAVTWLVTHKNYGSRDAAVSVLTKCIQAGFFYHVTKEKNFEDSAQLYRFVDLSVNTQAAGTLLESLDQEIVDEMRSTMSELFVPSKDNTSNQEENICVVCADAIADTILSPCGHSVACHFCLGTLSKSRRQFERGCPVCRSTIENVKKLAPQTLEQLHQWLRNHLKLHIHRHNFKSFTQCFQGNQAIELLSWKWRITTKAASLLCEALYDAHLIQALSHSNRFYPGSSWYQLVDHQGDTQIINKTPLHVIAKIMKRMKKEVIVADRKVKMRLYVDCFVGEQAVTWLVARKFADNRLDACRIGKLALNAGMIHHVTRSCDFKDSKEFYRHTDWSVESLSPWEWRQKVAQAQIDLRKQKIQDILTRHGIQESFGLTEYHLPKWKNPLVPTSHHIINEDDYDQQNTNNNYENHNFLSNKNGKQRNNPAAAAAAAFDNYTLTATNLEDRYIEEIESRNDHDSTIRYSSYDSILKEEETGKLTRKHLQHHYPTLAFDFLDQLDHNKEEELHEISTPQNNTKITSLSPTLSPTLTPTLSSLDEDDTFQHYDHDNTLLHFKDTQEQQTSSSLNNDKDDTLPSSFTQEKQQEQQLSSSSSSLTETQEQQPLTETKLSLKERYPFYPWKETTSSKDKSRFKEDTIPPLKETLPLIDDTTPPLIDDTTPPLIEEDQTLNLDKPIEPLSLKERYPFYPWKEKSSSKDKNALKDIDPTLKDINPTLQDINPITDTQSTKDTTLPLKDINPVLKDINLKDINPVLKDINPVLKDINPVLKDINPVLKDINPTLLKDINPLLKDINPTLKHNNSPSLQDINPLKDINPLRKDFNNSLKDFNPLKDSNSSLKEKEEDINNPPLKEEDSNNPPLIKEDIILSLKENNTDPLKEEDFDDPLFDMDPLKDSYSLKDTPSLKDSTYFMERETYYFSSTTYPYRDTYGTAMAIHEDQDPDELKERHNGYISSEESTMEDIYSSELGSSTTTSERFSVESRQFGCTKISREKFYFCIPCGHQLWTPIGKNETIHVCPQCEASVTSVMAMFIAD